MGYFIPFDGRFDPWFGDFHFFIGFDQVDPWRDQNNAADSCFLRDAFNVAQDGLAADGVSDKVGVFVSGSDGFFKKGDPWFDSRMICVGHGKNSCLDVFLF